ncbi:MAG TPA: hypothetical protein HPP97_06865 [Desulfuromonadales bacterium]|nr:hypothetical protein [Desulfuromonadales bacterium]
MKEITVYVVSLLMLLLAQIVLATDPPAKLKLRDPAATSSGQKAVDKDPTTGMELVFVKGDC